MGAHANHSWKTTTMAFALGSLYASLLAIAVTELEQLASF